MLRMVESHWMERYSSKFSTEKTAAVGSATCQMTTEPMMIGLPSASLTFCLRLSSVRVLSEIFFG